MEGLANRIVEPRAVTPLSDATLIRKANRGAAQWPALEDTPCRLEPEVWPILRPRFDLSDAKSIYTIGSCFARNIEEHMQKAGFTIPALGFAVPDVEWKGRPNGILNKFTPPSVYQEMQWTAAMIDAKSKSERAALLELPLINIGGGQVIDAELAGFLPVTLERAIERRMELFELGAKAFESDVVVITFGLLEAWWDQERKRYLQQTPGPTLVRLARDRFSFVWMKYKSAMYFARRAIDLITERSTRDVKFLLTVSPVPINTTFTPYDVIVANMYAKSTLRAVCGDLLRSHPNVDYFPSYESAMMTPRDKVFGGDQIHVWDSFVEKIVAQLMRAHFNKAEAVRPERAVSATSPPGPA